MDLTRAYEVPAETGAKVVEDSVAVRLVHLCMNVVAGVAQVRDFLG
jgi:hypothetical protein